MSSSTTKKNTNKDGLYFAGDKQIIKPKNFNIENVVFKDILEEKSKNGVSFKRVIVGYKHDDGLEYAIRIQCPDALCARGIQPGKEQPDKLSYHIKYEDDNEDHLAFVAVFDQLKEKFFDFCCLPANRGRMGANAKHSDETFKAVLDSAFKDFVYTPRGDDGEPNGKPRGSFIKLYSYIGKKGPNGSKFYDLTNKLVPISQLKTTGFRITSIVNVTDIFVGKDTMFRVSLQEGLINTYVEKEKFEQSNVFSRNEDFATTADKLAKFIQSKEKMEANFNSASLDDEHSLPVTVDEKKEEEEEKLEVPDLSEIPNMNIETVTAPANTGAKPPTRPVLSKFAMPPKK